MAAVGDTPSLTLIHTRGVIAGPIRWIENTYPADNQYHHHVNNNSEDGENNNNHAAEEAGVFLHLLLHRFNDEECRVREVLRQQLPLLLELELSVMMMTPLLPY